MNLCGAQISSRYAYIMEQFYMVWYGSLHQHLHVFTNKFYGKDGVCLALLGRLIIRAWYVNPSVCVHA